MIKCPSCGFKNDDSCTFCAICGSPVAENDNFYVHSTVGATSISVDELNKKLILQDKQENAKTKSFKKLNKEVLAKKAAKITDASDVKIYKTNNAKSVTSKSPIEKETLKNTPVNNSVVGVNKNDNTNATSIENKKTKNKQKSNDSEKKAVAIHTEDNTKKYKPETENKNNMVNKSGLSSSDDDTKLYNSETITKDKNEGKTETVAKNNTENYNSNITDENNSKLYAIFKNTLFGANDESDLFDEKDIEENCIFAILSYIPFLFFVPMIVKPKSGYLRYHGIQGLTMFLTFIILEFFNVIICAVIDSVSNSTTSAILTIIVTLIINLFILLLISIGIANAVKGIARELPVVGKYKLLKL